MKESIKRNIRRVAGGLLLLLAFIPFLYTTINLCFLFSAYDIRPVVTDFSTYVPFTISEVITYTKLSGTSLSMMLWCLQFVLPAFMLGSQAVKRHWNPMNRWVLAIMMIIAILGVAVMLDTALYQYYLIEMCINDSAKEQEVMLAVYGGGSLIGPVFDLFSFFMCTRLYRWKSWPILVGSLFFSVALMVNSLYWLQEYVMS